MLHSIVVVVCKALIKVSQGLLDSNPNMPIDTLNTLTGPQFYQFKPIYPKISRKIMKIRNHLEKSCHFKKNMTPF